jgi:hypothetical protein
MTKAKPESGTIEIDGETYATHTFEVAGGSYTLRELSADESDDIWDASKQPDGTVNTRLNTRLLLAKSVVEPSTTMEQVGKWGSQKFGTIMRHFNRLNAVPEENPTPPAGSAGPTPPAGGEPSPAS